LGNSADTCRSASKPGCSPDARLAKAVVDRLTHRSHIIDTGTVAHSAANPSIHERRQRAGDFHRAERAKPQSPAAIKLLTEAVLHAPASELRLVVLGTFVSRDSLEGRVKSIATVINRPDRDSIGNRSGLDGKVRVRAHAFWIDHHSRQLEGRRQPPGPAETRRRLALEHRYDCCVHTHE
jgi:hypothetical protein